MINKKIAVISIILAVMAGLSAQTAVKGTSLNGSTGLITTPSARIGWEKSDVGLDMGYNFLARDDDFSHVPRLTLSLVKMVEISAALGFSNEDQFGYMINGKFQFLNDGGTTMAAGFDFSGYDWNTEVENDYIQLMRPYFAATYGGNFFDAPAVTTVVFGWDMYDGHEFNFDNFNYSMGFELSLFPKTFKNVVYWISDFANYEFSVFAPAVRGVNAGSRGIYNTGFRLDPIKDSKYKFIIDIIGTDLLDPNRGFMVGGTFGLAL